MKTDKHKIQALPQEVVAKIPDVKSAPELVELGITIKSWQDKLAEIDEELGLTRNHPNESPRPAKPTTEADAQCLIDGGDIGSLSGPDTKDRRRDLNRQHDAVALVIRQLTADYISITAELCRAACTTLETIAVQQETALLDAYCELDKQLAITHEFYQTMNSRGIKQGQRPAHWCITSFDVRFWQGADGFPCLEVYADQRKKIWGIK